MYYAQEESIYENEEWPHSSEEPSIGDTQDFIEGLIEAVYHTGSIEMLERCIDELASMYDVKYEYRQPQIDKKKHPLMQWFTETQKITRGI